MFNTNANASTNASQNVQNVQNVQQNVDPRWADFREKAKNSTYVVPLSLKPGQFLNFVDFVSKKTRSNKDLLLLVTDTGLEVPLFTIPEVAKVLQASTATTFNPFSIQISEVIKNGNYVTYLCSKA